MDETNDDTTSSDPMAVILARLEAIESRLSDGARSPEIIAAEADADVARIEAQADADVARMEAAAEAESKVAGDQTDGEPERSDDEPSSDATPALDHPYFRPWGRRS